MNSADRQKPDIAQLRTDRLKEKIAALMEQMQVMKVVEQELAEAPDGRLSMTDPDARSMNTRGTGIVGYNVQTAVETRHHLIVEHDVTNAPTDRRYYSSEELRKCHEAGIAAVVPKVDDLQCHG